MKTSDNETRYKHQLSLSSTQNTHPPPPKKKITKNVTLWLFRRQPGRGKGEDKRGEGEAGRN